MQNISKNKGAIRLKIYLVSFLLLIGVGIYGYVWFQKNNALRLEAQNVIKHAEQYNILKEMITDERQRCESFIAQEEGDFGSFEYCKKFIQQFSAI